jgi:hypothetical protein
MLCYVFLGLIHQRELLSTSQQLYKRLNFRVANRIYFIALGRLASPTSNVKHRPIKNISKNEKSCCRAFKFKLNIVALKPQVISK